MKVFYLTVLLIAVWTNSVYCQSPIAITIDDVPNTQEYEKDCYTPVLLIKLDSLAIPVTIYITGGLIYKNDSVVKNKSLLKEWIKRDFVSLGNHTYGHFTYSKSNMEDFVADVEKGEGEILDLAKEFGKPLSYFRFPFNDLGKDSIQHRDIEKELESKAYIISPFTIESSDWMFNSIYEYYLSIGQKDEARRIAHLYLKITLEYFDFFDSVAISQYGRHINQIYLCHDNTLNADYLDVLVNSLKERQYTFISLFNAMEDSVYKQEDVYYKKWGVSWIYRWMENQVERIELMKQEPDMSSVLDEYQSISKNK